MSYKHHQMALEYHSRRSAAEPALGGASVNAFLQEMVSRKGRGRRMKDGRCHCTFHWKQVSSYLIISLSLGICGSPGCSNGQIGPVDDNMLHATTRLFPKTVEWGQGFPRHLYLPRQSRPTPTNRLSARETSAGHRNITRVYRCGRWRTRLRGREVYGRSRSCRIGSLRGNVSVRLSR